MCGYPVHLAVAKIAVAFVPEVMRQPINDRAKVRIREPLDGRRQWSIVFRLDRQLCEYPDTVWVLVTLFQAKPQCMTCGEKPGLFGTG